MRRSTTSSLFPDINVWIALTLRAHAHHLAAQEWLGSISDATELCFCRLTQIGFLRLLTTPAIMENRVLSQSGAWDIYDDWLQNGRARYVEEPLSVEGLFRLLSCSAQAAAKDWADSYISAFAQVSGLRLVTFDQTLHKKTVGSILLS